MSGEVTSVWICRSSFFAYDENNSLSESVVILASKGEEMCMKDLSIFELSLDNWLDCPLKMGLESLLLSKGNQRPIDLVFETNYTLFYLLQALRSTFTDNNPARKTTNL